MKIDIDLAIYETSMGYKNSQVPVKLLLHCLLDSSINDMPDIGQLLDTFSDSASE